VTDVGIGKQIVLHPDGLGWLWNFSVGRKMRDLNFENEASVLWLIENELRPYFEDLGPRMQHEVKESFRYALNLPDDRVLLSATDEGEIPYRPPKDVRGFYERIWTELFYGEDFRIDDLSKYRLDPDKWTIWIA
jgi:hypothetical protein